MDFLSKRLFGTSGIRGSIADKVTVDLALGLGRALGTFLGGNGTVGVGADARTSREMLRGVFVSGMLSTGVNVVDLGIAPMPTVAYHSSLADVSASVIVTASHNPPGDNGFKFFVSGREFIRTEEVFLEDRVADKQFLAASWDSVGWIRKSEIQEAYLKEVREFALKRGEESDGMKVLVDAANGAATDYTPQLLRDLGFSVISINSHQNGHFPGRLPEPSPRNLADTMKIAADSDFSVTLCHDGDGDRLAVIDEKGQFIDQNRVIALFARDEVQRNGGGTVLVSIDTSSVIDEVVKAEGGEVVRAPLGSLQELFASKKDRSIVFASEPWKPIFTELGDWMDGITGAALVSQMVDSTGSGSCVKLMKTVPEYPMLRDFISCPDDVKPMFLTLVKDILIPQLTGIEKIIEEDGIRVERADGSYVLVRVSGTEPKARVYVGAKTKPTLNKLAKTAMDSMKRAIDEAQK